MACLSCLRYCKSTSFQANHNSKPDTCFQIAVVCDTAKVRVFKQITTDVDQREQGERCLRYCKSTSFQANHNLKSVKRFLRLVVCDTAKVRVFKQITTAAAAAFSAALLFAILQKYEFSSKSQRQEPPLYTLSSCLRYCKSTSFQANHN